MSGTPSGRSRLGAVVGSVLPVRRAEELLATLPGVIAARIVAGAGGEVEEIHILSSSDVTVNQAVRNVESALIAHFGMRVDPRKISVATSVEPRRGAGVERADESVADQEEGEGVGGGDAPRRVLYFEDVEVRRSRSKGVHCRVTLRRGEESHIGEAEGVESERSRVDLAARATLQAVLQSEGGERGLALDGAVVVEAFGREFVFAGVTVRSGREAVLLTGSCEVRDSAETAAALAVLDATNRWIGRGR